MRCSASSGATKGRELTYALSKAPFVITGAFDTYVEVTDDLAVNLPAAERAGCAWPVRWHSPHKPWSRHTSKRHLAYNDSPNPALSVPRLLPLLQSLISRR